MTLEDFAEIQGLSEAQTGILKGVAEILVGDKIILNEEQLYNSLAADNAFVSVVIAAKIFDRTPQWVRLMGKQGKFKVIGKDKTHLVECKSILNYLQSQ